MEKTYRAAPRAMGMLAALVLGLAVIVATPTAADAAGFSGTVNGPSGAAAGVTVFAYATQGDDLGTPLQAVTGSDGKYAITAPAGKYRLYFLPTVASALAAEWDGDTPYETAATIRTVTASGTLSVGATLAAGGSISGSVPSGWTTTALLWNPIVTKFERRTYSASSSGSYQIGALPAGEYLVQFTPPSGTPLPTNNAAEYWKARTMMWDARSVKVASGAAISNIDIAAGTTPDLRDIQRVNGADRWESSSRMSALGFPRADTVFIATGLDYPDALSAGPAAAALGAPVLLTDTVELKPPAADELERLSPKTVVVVGGTASISDTVITQIKSIVPGADVTRIAATDRYDSSRKVARFAFAGSNNTTAYMAIGNNFPDALAAGAAAALEHAPLILDSGSGTLDPATQTLLVDLGIERVVIVGTTAIPASTETAIRNLPSIKQVLRRTGADRYITSANTGLGAFQAADTVLLTTGIGFPDALSGVALAGALGAPMYLVQSTCVPPSIVAEIQRLRPQTIYILGSNNTLSVGLDDMVVCP